MLCTTSVSERNSNLGMHWLLIATFVSERVNLHQRSNVIDEDLHRLVDCYIHFALFY